MFDDRLREDAFSFRNDSNLPARDQTSRLLADSTLIVHVTRSLEDQARLLGRCVIDNKVDCQDVSGGILRHRRQSEVNGVRLRHTHRLHAPLSGVQELLLLAHLHVQGDKNTDTLLAQLEAVHVRTCNELGLGKLTLGGHLPGKN